MKRYSELDIERRERGKVYTKYLVDDFDKDARVLTTYVPTLQERFDNIAKRFYGDENKWYIIARANNEVRGKLHATPGKELIIPRI